jgi:PAS domain S-box-containing protein
MSSKSSGIHIIFPSVMLGLTLLVIGIGWWSWRDTRRDIFEELSNAASLLERYYSLTFNQRELSLLSIGQRLSEISGEDQAEERLRVANQALALYDDLSAIGFADTSGQILTLTGYNADDKLPNLSQGDATSRSFQQAKESDGMVIGEVYYFDRVNDWIIPIRVPVRNENGTLVAVNTSAVIYETMIRNLKSFGFPDYITVHLINQTYGSTQLYYPLERSKYYSILQQSGTILSDYQLLEQEDQLTAFTAYNELSQMQMLGVQSTGTKFNHYVEITAPAGLIEDRFWAVFQYISAIYFLGMLVILIAFWYFSTTEEKYTKELQAERDYSNQIVERTPSLIIGLDAALNCIFVNPATERILGFPKEELIDQNWWGTILQKPDQEAIPKRYLTLAERELKDEMISCFNRSGETRQISWSSVTLRDKKGELDEIFLFGNDQTEKEATNEKLKQREANLYTLIESTNSIIGLYDDSKRLIEYNQAFKNYTDATTDISLRSGIKVAEMMEEPYSSLFNDYLDRCLKGEKVRETVEFEGKGLKFFFLFNYHPIYRENKIVGVSMFVEDISELKRSQDKLQKYSEDLESLVEERTQELKATNANMRKTNKELKHALHELKETQNQLIENEKMASLGVLSAGIGHEINNPLNFIKNGASGLAKTLKEDVKPDHSMVETFIKIIDEGVSRASNIVKSLSHFSRSGENMRETCELGEIIDNSLTILQNKLKHKVEVTKSIDHSGLKVLGNEGKLHQAVLNILTNAEQSIEDQGTIDISTNVSEDHIILRITDSGSGIPSDIMGKISDPFFTTKDPGEGTGLGLSITYSIIKEHNGYITVTSELGKGTTFTIHLPVN